MFGHTAHFIAFFVVLGMATAAGGSAISEVRHKELPPFESRIQFSPFRPPDASAEFYHDVRFNPGVWTDVKILTWKLPFVTISGYRPRRGFETADVHLQCFPLAMRSRIGEAARKAGPILARPDELDSMVLRDGTILRKYSVAKAGSEGAWIEHAGGTLFVPKANLTPTFFARHNVIGSFVFLRELELASGEKRRDVRLVVAPDGVSCRISHESGNQKIPLEELPPAAKAMVQELVEKGLFAEEVIVDPNSLVKTRKSRAAEPAPVATPSPPLEKTGPLHYAVLPLADGRVLHDARIVALTGFGVEIVAREGELSVSKEALPDAAGQEAGVAFFPLFGEFLEHGLMATGRSGLYELLGKNGAASDLGEAAKMASGGRLVARTGPGFLVTEGRWKSNGGGAVQFPKPLGGVARGFVLEEEFAHLGQSSWRKWWLDGRPDPLFEIGYAHDRRFVFKPAIPGTGTVLLHACDPGMTILTNRKGAIRRAWKIFPVRVPDLAFVETEAGFYFGVLSEQENLPESQMSWEQVLAARSGRHVLEKVSQKSFREGSPLIQATPSASGAPSARLLIEPDHARVGPGYFRTLLEDGMTSLCARLDAEQAEIEVLRAGEGEAFSRGKESEIEKISLQFLSVSPASATFKVSLAQREREVERERDPDGWVRVTNGPWKSKKSERVWELERDPDGGLRFTDGKFLYDLAFPKVGGFLLSTYVVKENTLNRSPR